jgi:hypothetical protein
MKKKFFESVGVFLLVLLATLVGAFLGNRTKAYAIPAFARALGVSCDQCHTEWPRLNAFGRKFMAKGYIDHSSNPGFPITAKLAAEWDITTTPGLPSVSNAFFPTAVDFFLGDAILPNVGVFAEVDINPTTPNVAGDTMKAAFGDMRLAVNLDRIHPQSVVVFKGDTFSWDPYFSLGNLSPEEFLEAGTVTSGYLYNPFNGDSFGVVYNGYFGKNNDWYGAIGVVTAGPVTDSLGLGLGTVDSFHGNPGYVARIAHEELIGNEGGSWNVGAAYYNGSQSPVLQLPNSFYYYRGGVDRYFVDGGFQLPMNQDGTHWLEFMALYGYGTDRNVPELDPTGTFVASSYNGEVKGYYLQADYTGMDGLLGPIVVYDHTTLQDPVNGALTTNTEQFGIQWNPMQDFKVQVLGGPMTDNRGNSSTTYSLILTKMF